jgi:hypothetical protein
MRKSRPRKTRVRRCKLPGFFSTILAPEGSVWSCPRCGDEWEVVAEPLEDWNYGEPEWNRKYLKPLDPRSAHGCGSWSCACGPHEEQIYDSGYFMDPDAEPVEIPLLCMEHRRHEPCRRCT